MQEHEISKKIEQEFLYNDPHVYGLLLKNGLLSTVINMLTKERMKYEQLKEELSKIKSRTSR